MDCEDINTDDVLGVEMVGFIDFDIINGTQMSHQYPIDADFGSFTSQFLANCSLPDGAHLHQTDQSYMVIPSEDKTYYGIAFFRNKSDKSATRGAIQRALIIISRQPHFHLFEQPAYEVIEASMETAKEDMAALLLKFYNSLKINPEKVVTTTGLDKTSHHAELCVFDYKHKLSIPNSYPPLQFDSTSARYMVSHLKVCKNIKKKSKKN